MGHLPTLADLPHALQIRIIERGGGNPFYIEELLRSIAETGATLQDQPRGNRRTADGIVDLPIPDTLHGILADRIDQLPRKARQTLQLASVIGRIFPYRLLAAVADKGGIDDTLVRLQREGMIRQRTAPPEERPNQNGTVERTFIFKHQLTLEATYAGLLRRKRRALHRRIAEAMMQLYSDQMEMQVGLLAHHWEAAGHQGQAVRFLKLAAEQAEARFANAEAIDYLNRALNLIPEEDLESQYNLILSRERIHNICGDREPQIADLEELHRLAETQNAPPARRAAVRAQVALREADCGNLHPDQSHAMAAAKRAVDLARVAHDIRVEAQAHVYWGRATPPGKLRTERLTRALEVARRAQARAVEVEALYEIGADALNHGNWSTAHIRLQESLDISRAAGDRMGEGRTLTALAHAKWQAGDSSGVRRLLQEGLHICHQTGNRWQELWASGMMGYICESCGSYAEAKPHYSHAIGLARQVSYQRAEIGALAMLGTIHAKLGDLEAAQACYHEATALRLDPVAVPAMTNLGKLAYHLGDHQAALRHCQQASDITPIDVIDREVLLIVYGDVLSALSKYDEATERYREAIAAHEQVGWIRMVMEAEAGLARVLLAQGKLPQALAQVEDILTYRETTHPTFEGARDIYTVFLTCYRVLDAAGDPRAWEVLEAGHSFLQERAAAIEDQSLRRTFLAHVPNHRSIVEAWEQHLHAHSGR